MSPFEVVHGYTPRRPLDLLPISSHDRVSVSAISVSAIEFASHMHELHKEINKRIQASNLKYKPQVDLHRRDLDFDVGDYVMIRIKPKRYPSGTFKKLQARSASPFKVLKKLGSNAYVIDIPSDYGISSTFNIADLIAFKGPAIIPYEPFDDPPSSSLANPIPSPTPSCFQKAHKDIIDVILDEQSLFTRDGTVQFFLVHWRGRPDSDCTWITREELQQLDPILLEAYLDTLATTSSLPPITRTYEHRRRRHADLVSLWLDGTYSDVLMSFTRRGRVSPTPGELVQTPHDSTSVDIIFIIYVIFIWVHL